MMTTMVACLAVNLFWEARGEPLPAQVAITNVVLARAADPRFPNTPCEVIREGPVGKNGVHLRWRCQFTWLCDGQVDTIKKADADAYRSAVYVVEGVLTGAYDDGFIDTSGATYYHTTAVSVAWPFATPPNTTAVIGSHVFYRLPQGVAR